MVYIFSSFPAILGGWSEIKRQRQRVKGDQRILGDSEFVLKILTETGEHAVSYVVTRGKKIAEEKELQLTKELLNN